MGFGQSTAAPSIEALAAGGREWLRKTSKLLLTSLAFLVIGLLGGLTSRNGWFWFLFIVGIVLLLVWLSRQHGLLTKEQVVDQWGTLIGDGQGRADEIFEATQRFIIATNAPAINMERRDVAPGVIRGLAGGKRPFLLVSHNSNSNLKGYRMYLGARDYGNNLQVSWYVIHKPGLRQALGVLFSIIPFVNLIVLPFYLIGRLTKSREAGLLDLDLFDEQDLRAYVTNAHRCLITAVEKLMTDLNQDPSTLERKSRGFLGIS